MLEKLLSRQAYKIYIVFMVVVVAYGLWMLFTESGIIGWLNTWQALHLFKGYYYPELSILLLLLPVTFLGLGVGLAFDFFTGQGIFAHRDQSAETPDPSDRITYRETARPEVIAQVREKFAQPMRQLRFMGFEELCIHSETIPWLGLRMGPLGFVGALGFLGNEVTRWGPRLTVSGFFPLMVFRSASTYANIFNMGVSFYTRFTDGTCLITSNYPGIEIKDENARFYKAAGPKELSLAWAEHVRRVEKMREQGKVVLPEISFARYLDMSRQVDEYGMKRPRQVVKVPSEGPSVSGSLLPTVVAMGVFIALLLVAMFPLNLMAVLQPSCWFVRSMSVMPLVVHFLAIILSLGLSWGLARLLRGDQLLTVNGMGLRMYGSDPAPDGNGLISTKWLVLPFVPLIPVRSYRVLAGGSLPAGVIRMEPLPELAWDQVWDTARRASLAYLILAALLLALPLWALFECS